MTMSNGWRPEPNDAQHWSYETRLLPLMRELHAADVDLRSFSSPRHDQQTTNSCVAQATVKALEIKRIMEHGAEAHVDLSRRAVYYLAREQMNPPQHLVDDGTYIGHAFDVLRRFGVPPEEDHPWHDDEINVSPDWLDMRKAFLHKIDSFYRIFSTGGQRIAEVVRCLRAHNPVVFGTTVGNNWQDYTEDSLPLRLPVDVTGRHATVIVGYVDGHFIGENSWGTEWGRDGFYLLAPAVVASEQSGDFWVVQAGFEEYAK